MVGVRTCSSEDDSVAGSGARCAVDDVSEDSAESGAAGSECESSCYEAY